MKEQNKEEYQKYLPKGKKSEEKKNTEYASPNMEFMKNLLLTFLHVIILDFFLSMTFYVQLLGIKDTKKTMKSGEYTLKIFDVNMSFFALGIVLFIIVYAVAYYFFIRRDFIKLSTAPLIWKIFTGFIILISFAMLIYEHALVIVFVLGIHVTLNPASCELIIFYMIFLMIITPLVDLLYNKILVSK